MTGRVYANAPRMCSLHEDMRYKQCRHPEAQGMHTSSARASNTLYFRSKARERKEDWIMHIMLSALQCAAAIGIFFVWVCRSESIYLAPLAEIGFYWLVGTAAYFGVNAVKKPIRALHCAAAVAVGIMWTSGTPCTGAAVLGAVWLVMTAIYWALKAVITAVYKPTAALEGR